MQCPKCPAQTRPQILADVLVELCAGCEGTWFDRDKLEIVSRNARESSLRERTPLRLVARDSGLACPRRTGRALARYGAWDFHVERCDECAGIFLDGHEIAELSERWRRDRTSQRGSRPNLPPGVPGDSIWAQLVAEN